MVWMTPITPKQKHLFIQGCVLHCEPQSNTFCLQSNKRHLEKFQPHIYLERNFPSGQCHKRQLAKWISLRIDEFCLDLTTTIFEIRRLPLFYPASFSLLFSLAQSELIPIFCSNHVPCLPHREQCTDSCAYQEAGPRCSWALQIAAFSSCVSCLLIILCLGVRSLHTGDIHGSIAGGTGQERYEGQGKTNPDI